MDLFAEAAQYTAWTANKKTKQGGLDDLKGKTICTYRNGGYRGNIGADELNKKGFTAVTIDGGYEAWKEERKMPDDKIG